MNNNKDGKNCRLFMNKKGRHQPSVCVVALIKTEIYQDGWLFVPHKSSSSMMSLSRGSAPLDPHNLGKG